MSETAQPPASTAKAPVPAANATPPAELHLSLPQRAAIILSLLEPDNARSIAEHFDEGRVDRAVEAFESLRMVGRRDLLATIKAFTTALEGDFPVVAGGQRRASVLAEALMDKASLAIHEGEEPPVLENQGSVDEGADAEAVWAYVRALDPAKIGALLRKERPAVVAAVLQRISTESATAVLDALVDESATEVVRLVLSGRQPAPPTYNAIAESLRRNAADRIAEANQPSANPADQLAEVFNVMTASRQDAILEPLRVKQPGLVESLEGKLLRFEILHERLPKTIVPTLFRELDNKVVDPALKLGLQSHKETAEFLLGSISQRLAEQIRERIEESPALKPGEGEDAQTEIMKTLIAWCEEGRFTFKAPPTEE
ncbi:MAG: FliG C-terminal domain-containing protein [Planctomycetota bacterium]